MTGGADADTVDGEAASALASLTAYLDASPSPYHAVANAAGTLERAGFVDATAVPGGWEAPAGFVRRDGSLVAWRRGRQDAAPSFRVVGAHTDSPNLRLKPVPTTAAHGWQQLAVEVYGGVLLNSWLDRDLGIAGRAVLRSGGALPVLLDEAVARIPQLAIHLDREVNDKGLLLDRQAHLAPVVGLSAGPLDLPALLAGVSGIDAGDVAVWDLMLYDLTPARLIGARHELLASGRLDNLVSCWASCQALVDADDDPGHTSVVVLFDHEEVGSASTTGAAGPLLEHALERLALAAGLDRSEYLAALSHSSCISADNAHAVHPNYPDRHEPGHRPLPNRGPALKVNANQRYATSAASAARFLACCDAAGVPWQTFVSRNTMPCGSTIGPITATRLGIDTVDVGIPQLSMHSARELCGADDPALLARTLTAYFSGA
jgi:aspartyl aminopeptidase